MRSQAVKAPSLWAFEFRGHATRLEPGVVLVRAIAPSRGVDERGEALLECRLTFFDDSRFSQVGTIGFADGSALRFRSTVDGELANTTDPNLRHGTVTREIDGGSGPLRDVTGRIVSNFLLSDTGDFTDHELALVFARNPLTVH
jgi:hypothetical protein